MADIFDQISPSNNTATQAKGDIFDQISQQPQTRFTLASSQPLGTPYSYLDALKDTGKTVVNSLADLGQNTINTVKNIPQIPGQVINAIQHPIQTAQGIGQGISNKINEYNSMDKLATKVSTDPFGFGSDVVGAGLLTQGAVNLATGAIKTGSEIPNIVNRTVAPIRDYAGNKVNAIRAGAKQYWKAETGAYGDAIDSLGNDKSSIQSGPVLENMTSQIVDRGLYDNTQGKWLQPLNRVDMQLKKSYDVLFRKAQDSGQIAVADVVREYQNIRDSVPVDSTLGKDARTVANNFIYSLNKQIDLPALKDANARYSEFKNNFNAIDSKVDVWGNPLQTAKGESFLTKGINQTKQARVTAQSIESNTGQNLKLAKTLSTINNFPILKWFIH